MKGLSVHCSRGLLIEWCHSYKERVDYILKHKSEQKTRLKLFKMLSTEAIADLPKHLVEMAYEYDEANRKLDKANHNWADKNRKLEEVNHKREKAHRKWQKAGDKLDAAHHRWEVAHQFYDEYNRWITTNEAKQWHDKHCGCKEWSWEKNNL